MIKVELTELEAEKVRACIMVHAIDAELQALKALNLNEQSSLNYLTAEHFNEKAMFYRQLADKFREVK